VTRLQVIMSSNTNTAGSYWYRTMFDEHFPPSCASTVMRWTPKWVKQTDPSGR